jgi:hypothetical protein
MIAPDRVHQSVDFRSPPVLAVLFGCRRPVLFQFVQPVILERVTPPRNLNAGKTKYFQVKPKTPIIDVPEIKGHSLPHLLHLGCLSPEAVHLRPPRHPSRGSPFRL